jgi:methylmalonyl-CoA epimerase
MIGRLNHLAIVVPDLAAAAANYAETLGAKVTDPIDLPDHGVTTIFVELPNTKIELLHPLGGNSPVAKYLEKNPDGGMHHVCYEVVALAYWVTVSRASARTASRYCFFILRISAEPWWKSSRSRLRFFRFTRGVTYCDYSSRDWSRRAVRGVRPTQITHCQTSIVRLESARRRQTGKAVPP